MRREIKRVQYKEIRREAIRKGLTNGGLASLGALSLACSPLMAGADPNLLFGLGAVPALAFSGVIGGIARDMCVERERKIESERRRGKKVLGMPPRRDCFRETIESCRARGKGMIDKYMVGFSLETGEPLWIDEEDLCSHACVFAKTGVGKTLWMESLIFQQMLRGRASGLTFIDAKRDSGTLAQIILMAVISGRIEDLVVVDPFEPIHAYNFTLTDQRADVKSRKVLRAGLPPTSDNSATKHYDRLAADSISRMIRGMESFGLAWSIHDIAVALSAFQLSYPHLRSMLQDIGARQAMVELGHLASSYRNVTGKLDAARLTDNLRGISSELHAITGSEMGSIFCTNYTDLILSDAMLRGKIIYFMLPRLEEAEGAARMVKVFREDLEISIGEITSSRQHNLEDPHLVMIDEGSSTFGPTWANLFELARKGRFALMFGAQSTGGLSDSALGLSEAFYERVMANVNLKVMMRIGDNRTALDMAEWFGKVATTRTSIGTGTSFSTSGGTKVAGIDVVGGRASGGESQSINISEDEEYFVSPEELKHEMSAEKGLAWFDLGNGTVVKGRAFWFNADVPDAWEGREYLLNFERFERDEIGLGDWVDHEILSVEEKESHGQQKRPKKKPGGGPGGKDSSTGEFQVPGGGSGDRLRGVVRSFPMVGGSKPKAAAAKAADSAVSEPNKSNSPGAEVTPVSGGEGDSPPRSRPDTQEDSASAESTERPPKARSSKPRPQQGKGFSLGGGGKRAGRPGGVRVVSSPSAKKASKAESGKSEPKKSAKKDTREASSESKAASKGFSLGARPRGPGGAGKAKSKAAKEGTQSEGGTSPKTGKDS